MKGLPASYDLLRVFVATIFLIFWASAQNLSASSKNPSDIQSASYTKAYQQNRLAETALPVYLNSAIRQSEYLVLAVGLRPASELTGLPVRLEEFGFDDFNSSHRARRTTTFAVDSDAIWKEAINILASQEDWLTDALQTGWITPSGNIPFEVRLIFQFPRQRNLALIGMDCVLSEPAQRYLTITAASDYPSRRKVLIFQEPHYELDRQFNLFKGLEVFFADNPRLLLEHRTAFLAEGLKSGESLSIAPLVQMEPRPNDDQIYDILGTFQIPGYVAYEWKHQHGIPIIGSEDEALHRFSAKVWTEMQNAPDGRLFKLWPATVAARNPQIAGTFLETLKRHANPILFVGGKHLSGLTEDESLRPSDWNDLVSSFSTSDLGILRSSDTVGVADILRSQGIGYWFISGRTSPFSKASDQRVSVQQYVSLFRQQLGSDSVPVARSFGSQTDSVTVSPSTEKAAKSVDGKKSRGKSKGDGTGSGGVLNGLLSGLKDAAGKAAKGFGRLSGILRDAAKGKGNFGLGSATRQEADELGKSWVGDGAKASKSGKATVSKDGTRQYRAPSFKPNLGRSQANFEQRSGNSGEWQSNGHLDITD